MDRVTIGNPRNSEVKVKKKVVINYINKYKGYGEN